MSRFPVKGYHCSGEWLRQLRNLVYDFFKVWGAAVTLQLSTGEEDVVSFNRRRFFQCGIVADLRNAGWVWLLTWRSPRRASWIVFASSCYFVGSLILVRFLWEIFDRSTYLRMSVILGNILVFLLSFPVLRCGFGLFSKLQAQTDSFKLKKSTQKTILSHWTPETKCFTHLFPWPLTPGWFTAH